MPVLNDEHVTIDQLSGDERSQIIQFVETFMEIRKKGEMPNEENMPPISHRASLAMRDELRSLNEKKES